MPDLLAASKASSRVLSLSTVSMPTHLPVALTGSLLMFLFNQRASGMSLAKPAPGVAGEDNFLADPEGGSGIVEGCPRHGSRCAAEVRVGIKEVSGMLEGNVHHMVIVDWMAR
eukprot:672827-Pelagomonas_calceolata.AAC.1